MTEPKVSSFEGWAVVEMFGHAKEIGYVTTEAFGAAVLFRCDTPELPEREFVLERPEYIYDDRDIARMRPAGSKVKRPGSPAKTRLIGPGAIYSITPCTEETARRAIEQFARRPLILLELPKEEQRALPATTSDPETPDPEDADKWDDDGESLGDE